MHVYIYIFISTILYLHRPKNRAPEGLRSARRTSKGSAGLQLRRCWLLRRMDDWSRCRRCRGGLRWAKVRWRETNEASISWMRCGNCVPSTKEFLTWLISCSRVRKQLFHKKFLCHAIFFSDPCPQAPLLGCFDSQKSWFKATVSSKTVPPTEEIQVGQNWLVLSNRVNY